MANHGKIDIIFPKFHFPQVFQTIMVNDFFEGKRAWALNHLDFLPCVELYIYLG